MICWYCGKARYVKFRHSDCTQSLTLLIQAVGVDEGLLEDFKAGRLNVLNKCL